MAHKEQRDFLLSVKKQFPERFENCDVLDIGSLDINGNNRYLFTTYTYIGIVHHLTSQSHFLLKDRKNLTSRQIKILHQKWN